MRASRLALVVSALLLAAPAAHASTSDDAARDRYEQGIQLYQQGRFEAAVDEFKAAYELTGSPALLFNLGQCYRQLGDRTSAIASYRAYLHQLPNAPNRADAEARLHDLEAGFVRVAPPTVTRPAVRPDRRHRAVLIGGLVAMGLISTSCLAGAGGLSLRAESAADALREVPPGTTWTEAQANLYDEGRRSNSAAIGLYAIGGVTLAAGIITTVLMRRQLAHASDARTASSRIAKAGPTWSF